MVIRDIQHFRPDNIHVYPVVALKRRAAILNLETKTRHTRLRVVLKTTRKFQTASEILSNYHLARNKENLFMNRGKLLVTAVDYDEIRTEGNEAMLNSTKRRGKRRLFGRNFNVLLLR